MNKAYWDLRWIPKKSDIKIVTRLNKEQKKEARDELWEELQGALHNLHVIETTQDVEQKDLHKGSKT